MRPPTYLNAERGRAPTFAMWGDKIRLIRDPTEDLYYIDAAPGYRPADFQAALDHARLWGLDAFDPAECDGLVLDDGTIRIPLDPAPDWLSADAQVSARVGGRQGGPPLRSRPGGNNVDRYSGPAKPGRR